MSKPFKKGMAVLAGFGLLSCSLQGFSYDVKAREALYHDSNVSILSALDRYVSTNEYAFADEWNAYQAELAKAEADATAVAEIAKDDEEEAIGVNKKEKKYVTGVGSIQRIDTEEEVTTEEVAEEEDAAEETVTVSSAQTYDFSGKAMNVSGGLLNIRESADGDSKKVGTIENGGIMTVSEQGDEWTHITSGSVDGYVKNDYIAFGDAAREYAEANLVKVAVVNCASLRVRAEASVDSEKLALLPEGESYEVVELLDGWTKIRLNTVEGYLNNEYIIISYMMPTAKAEADTSSDTPAQAEETTEQQTTPEETTEQTTEAPAPVPSSSVGQAIVDEALKYVGCPYVYGGNSLTNGTDCSGFTMLILAKFGYSLPHTATGQSYLGSEVSISALEPGDLVFYDHGTGSIEHVAIYMGGGQIVHASTPATGIMISNAFYSTPFKAVRIAK